MPGEVVAFMSYARFDDVHDEGQLTLFRERLGSEVRAQTGAEFAIFQDRNDIAWGQNWQQRIDEALDTVTLLLVIITPGLFRSSACRDEVRRFVGRERELGRSDLILPVYYITAREMDDLVLRESDELARVLASRQYADWRELRFEPFTSSVARRAIAQLAARMRDMFWQPPVPIAHAAAGSRQTEGGHPTAEPYAQVAETLGAAGRVTARTELPTRLVDAHHRGDFTSIGAAILAADPGDRILVRPGLYEESLVIDKPLEILGDGPVADIEVRARGTSVIAFRTSIGRVANLTLRQAGGEGNYRGLAGEGDCYGVNIMQGRLDLEGCDISSQVLACVAIHNGADPRLRRNKIHDGKAGGVLVYEDGRGTLEDNDVTGNTMAGIEIETGGDPILRRNQIRDGKAAGVLVSGSGWGTLEDNDITGNAKVGVEIKSGGNPTLRRNQIRDGKAGGVLVHEGGRGTLEDNDITGNTNAGVSIRTGGNPTLRHNQIHDGKAGGIFVYDDGRGTLENNDISRNALAGVEIKSGGDPTLRHNHIRDGKQSGIWVHEHGRGMLEDNDIIRNTYPGVEITSGGDPTLRRNQILDGKSPGVFVSKDGRGTLEDNDISGNALAGVEIKTGGNPTLRANRINRNGYEAVWVYDGGRGVVKDNDLTGNVNGAWNVASDCQDNVVRSGNAE